MRAHGLNALLRSRRRLWLTRVPVGCPLLTAWGGPAKSPPATIPDPACATSVVSAHPPEAGEVATVSVLSAPTAVAVPPRRALGRPFAVHYEPR